MAAYDDFAWFYDRYWNEDFHSAAFPILERVWLSRLPERSRILDVCCGTGYLAGMLVERGHEVTGVDASPEMIACARRNVPRADFQVAEASRFRMPAEFDGAVSTFDSLNHILELPDLTSALRNVAAALKPGGIFAFDILLEEAYQTHWGESFALVRDDHLLTITGSGFDFRTRRAQCTVTMFRLMEGAWRRSDTTVVERCYTGAEIGTALEDAAFGEITAYDAGDLGMAGLLGEGRTFFVATRV